MRSVSIILLFLFFACDVIIIDDISDKSIQLIYPEDNVSTPAETIDFRWDDMTGANSYRLQIVSQSFEQSSDMLVDTMVDVTSYVYTFTAKGQYQWRVSGVNDKFISRYAIRNLTIK